MPNISQPMRQIHLDFHTSGHIPDVGADWDADAFVETLQRAHVNSINLFARGHHGYVYYMPSRYTVHPSLSFDLLGQQIEACHRVGIRAPIYCTVGWDELASAQHPEWLEVDPDGLRGQHSPLEARWKKLCLNSPYLDYVYGQVMEVMDLFGEEVDGLWLDIIHQYECVCPACLESYARLGLNPECQADRLTLAQQVVDDYRRRLAEGIWARKPDCSIFHNSGHLDATQTATIETFSHLELESLPSTGIWGYNHYPISVRYARTLGKPHLGMTAKFHTAWGDFASFKSQPALEFECFQMLANGAACCVGDQLCPRARLSEPVYALIGRVYEQVEAVEPWCVDAKPEAEVAVFNVEAVGAADGRVDTSHSGCLRMLLEGRQQFDFVDTTSDWAKYRVLILPDKVTMDAALAKRVSQYLDGGGKILATSRSGLDRAGERFALDAFGLHMVGTSPHPIEYVLPRPELDAGLVDAPHVIYDQGMAVRPNKGTSVLADLIPPYFNRTWAHFCSHRQTPPDTSKRCPYPGMTLNAESNVLYIAHPLFYGYRRQAVPWYKALVAAALRLLLPDPMLTLDAPSTAQATMTRQSHERRTMVHLLHYIPERRGLEFDTIEDVIPIYDLALSFRVPEEPMCVYTAPSKALLPYQYENGRVLVTVPKVVGHQLVVAEW